MSSFGRSWPLTLLCAAVGVGVFVHVHAQTPGDNVNMVSGTTWPGGDPFLQRQNEPSIAVSSRNPLHLLAGANDYRTVDLPAPDVLPGSLAGDAWIGIFKSFDGGDTWQSAPLTGYPQDTSAEGLASPLRQFRAAADPTVREGIEGLFHMSGIAFNRDSDEGGVFVSTFFDQNNKENGSVAANTDPIRHVRTVVVETGNSGQFLDKPWIETDLPRAGAGSCTISVTPSETVPAGNVYLVWSRFTGSTSTKIMFSRSLDCGKTFQNPIKLSESSSINQGTVLAVNPLSGAVYAVWRRFKSSSESDAILFAKSTDFGQTFTKANEIASIIPFDQPTSSGSFRTNALPTIAVSVNGSQAYIHIAWAARTTAGGDARIRISTSTNEGTSWSVPANVDATPFTDDFGGSFTRGNSFMPALTFSAGKLMLAYYDQRLDHTLGLFHPNVPFAPGPDGRFYQEQRDPRGELPGEPDKVFTPTIDDTGLTLRRHTIDLRVAQAGPGASPSFTSAQVSRYKFGTRGDETGVVEHLQQLQVDPPGLDLFQQGTVGFFGDYIDIRGQTYLPDTPGGAWRYNTAPTKAPAHYVTFTSNRDVRPPQDGNWQNYTPVGGGGQSVFDPSQTTPICVSGQEGMRNQNIYLSRITQGLLVTSPQNAKPLSPTLERAVVVLVQNATLQQRTFRLKILDQPPGGSASFVSSLSPATCSFPSAQLVPCTGLDIVIPARSGIARSVFAKSTDPTARIRVSVDEVASVGGGVVSGGLSGSVVLNADPVTSLAQPDGTADDISTLEVYTPFISSANVSNANVSNANVSNANVSNANVSNANVSNANVSNAHVANPDLADANVSNANVSNANVSNANVSNANVSNANVSNAPLADATFTVTNLGNTTHSYHVKLVGEAPSPNVALQLIIQKLYVTPLGLNCELQVEPHNALLANIVNPIVGDPDGLFDPNIPDASAGNATLALAPGESAAITLRGVADLPAMTQIANRVRPRIIAHAGNGTPGEPFADPLVVTTDTDELPTGILGVPYSTTLQAAGGKAPYSWSVVAGALPPNLTLSTGGVVSGTPAAVGSTTLTVQVQDSSNPVQKTTQVLTLVVTARTTTTAVMLSPATAVVGQSVNVTATVTDTGPGTKSAPSGSVSFSSSVPGDVFTPAAPCVLAPSGAASASCSVSVQATTTGSRTLTAAYAGSATHAAGSGNASLSVGTPVLYTFIGFLSPLTTAGTMSAPSSSGSASFGSALPIKWQIKTSGGAFVTSLSAITSLQAIRNGTTCPGPKPPAGPTIQLYSPTMGTTGGSTFKYDTGSNTFHFNWDTSKGGTSKGCYWLSLLLDDGSPAKVTTIKLK